jgi:iron complex outermembrane recepter protein
MKTCALLLSASALALGWCGMAQAQTPPSDTKEGSATIETVVVTAERRNENLMTTAISADVLSGDSLQAKGVLKVDDLQFIAPTTTIDNFGQGIDFNIRGIGKGEHNTQTMTGVITYRDGVPTFPGYMLEEPYYDISSIEVLRGPQGTFVGQNATGGAVFVNSNDPVIGGGYDGYAFAQYGNYNDVNLQGALNIPLTDNFAIRIAVDGERRSSFYSILDRTTTANSGTNTVNTPANFFGYFIASPDNCTNAKYANCKPGYNPGDLQWGAVRVSALWKPTEALTVSFKTDTDYLDNGAYPADPYTDRFPVGTPLPVLLGYGGSTATLIANPQQNDLFHITANAPQVALDRFVRSVLKIDYVFPGGITLRSVSGYQQGNTNYTTDLDGTDMGGITNETIYGQLPNDYTFFDRVDETIWSQEINLISPDNQRFSWVFGAFAQSDRYGWIKPYQFIIGTPYIPGNGPVSAGGQWGTYALQGSTPNSAWAVFGQIGYKLTNSLQVQLGGRWSTNMAHNDVDIEQYGTFLQANQKTKSYSLDYKASVNWEVNDNNFLYAFVSTGYKPGGLNVPVYVGDPALPFKSERVTEYETGWKATLLDGHLRTTLDGYYNQYKGFQVTIAYPLLPTFGREINVPNTTKIYGVEAEVEAAFGNLSVSGGVGLMHSGLGGFYAVDSREWKTGLPCDPAAGNSANIYCVFIGGHPQTYAPSVTGDINVQYAFNLENGDTLTPRLSYAYQSGQWASVFDNPLEGDRLGVRSLLGAQFEWKHNDYTVTLYGTNLMDEHYVAAMNSGLDWAGPPRQFGVRLLKVF